MNHDTERQEDERERLQTRWNDLKQGPDEDVLAYLARAEILRLGLSRYNVTWTGREANRHIARHLNKSYRAARNHLVIAPDLSQNSRGSAQVGQERAEFAKGETSRIRSWGRRLSPPVWTGPAETGLGMA